MSTGKRFTEEEIFNSLEGIAKAPAPVFFYSTLQARMQRGFQPMEKRTLQPVLAFAVLLFFLMINISVLVKRQYKEEPLNAPQNEASFASAYHLTSSSVYE